MLSQINRESKLSAAIIVTITTPANDMTALLVDAVADARDMANPPGVTMLLAGLAGVVSGLVVVVLATDRWPLLVGGGLAVVGGVAGLATWWQARRRHHRGRDRLQAAFAAAGHPLPADWTFREALAQVAELTTAGGREAGTESLRARVQAELERRLATAHAEADRFAARRRERHTAAGGQGDPGRPDFLHDLDNLRRWRDADTEVAAARAALEGAEALRDVALEAARAGLADLGEEADATIPALEAAHVRLGERRTEARSLAETLATNRAARAAAADDLAAARSERDRLLERHGLADAALAPADLVTTIGARVQARPAWTSLSEEVRTAQRELERLAGLVATNEPGETEDAHLLDLDPAILQAERDRAAAQAGERDELNRLIASIETRVEQARNSDARSRARTREAEAAAALDEAVTAQWTAACGRLLLDEVAERHEADTRPPLLEAADAHLKVFTRGRYHLRLAGRTDAAGFQVLDEAERPRSLGQLSDGTRAQVFLAVRLAFLDEAEAGLALPLFLDETLTASDPVRFDAIAGALGATVGATGRQVFYLTSNPSDAAAWQRALADAGLAAPTVIDLGAARDLAAAASPDDLQLTPLPEVPEPDGDDAAAYGARLGVTPVDPWQGPGALDIFHLFRDDLALVATLARIGVRRVAHWQRQGRDLVQAGFVTADAAAVVDARIGVWQNFTREWQIGRGRPLDRAGLQECEALTDRMFEAAVELLEQVDGDGDAFAARVAAGAIKRLRNDKKEALQEFLERRGHISRGSARESGALVSSALVAAEPDITAGTLAEHEVRRLVLELEAAAG